ncbi:ABC-type transport system involved in multi-copper enzyme maturation permease subunit [Halomonas fontilapidosi]|uniref:ABC-type transport system involved in multi-copper enzyme maturation permease subunit n=1 Tax=Halomonas fontilapidosi TaxID=616675 RepID=A0A7W5DKR8_9GAMM|nr:DUF4149 domain-containing protein [Halomonas fontilapidosi]MBB3184239.1 ABC-type transport system involved in multi-copper enzyme maturation permease subunit [Halomonas fontilapidosi]
MLVAALLFTALLFGGAVLFSFGFAAFLLKTLPSDVARASIRRAFPYFYLFVLIVAAIASALLWPFDRVSSLLMAFIAITIIPTRQLLMPAINRATDAGNPARFKALHGLSVGIGLAHIVINAYVLVRFL